MASSMHVYKYDGVRSFCLCKWKIKVGHQLYYNSTILTYKHNEDSKSDSVELQLKYKSNIGGTVTELLVSEGDVVKSGMPILQVKPCSHPVIMKDLCAECGTDLRNLDRDKFENVTAAAAFSMVHVVPELKVCYEQAEKLSQDDEDRLLKNEKLVLLVDLDQTLIHTTNDDIPETLPVDQHFQLYGQYSPWYHTKLRPGTKDFLENISKYYELHICTFGARLYAHRIAQILDPKGKYFSHRILSRDECFDPTSKTANLKELFPKGDHMVCIIDDREDVWNFAPNLIRVKPYTFFRNTGDINAPPSTSEAACSNLGKSNLTSEIKPTQIENAKVAVVNTELKESQAILNTGDPEKTNEVKNISNIEAPKIPCNKKSDAESSNDAKKETTPKTNNDSKENLCMVNKTEDANHPQCSSNAESNNNETSAITVNNCTTDSEMKTDKENDSEMKTDKENDSEMKTDKENDSEAKTDKEKEEKKEVMDIVETDDYLLYLEEILISVHKAYYKLYKKRKETGEKSIPDLKKIVPDVRKKVLKNVNIVLSSIVPTNTDPEHNHFWLLAESLGATMQRDLVLDSSNQRTTHVIGLKPNTLKVKAARQHKDIWVVNLDWILCCDERWERADERLFLLSKDTDNEVENSESILRQHHRMKRPYSSEKKKQGKSEEDKFSERVFAEAGLALSQDEIDDMDREIEQACSEESEDSQDSKASSGSSSSVESLSSGDYPKGWKRRRKCDALEEQIMLNAVNSESSDVDTIGSVDEEMAEAVKREFQDF